MISVPLTTFFAAFLILGLFVIAGLWLFYDLRDHRLLDRRRKLRVFHCVKCDHLYSVRSIQEVENCPRCRFRNASLRF